DHPSSLVDFSLAAEPPTYDAGLPAPNVAPVIVDFNAEEVGNGLFIFSGRVIDEQPGGLTVAFGGVPSIAGLTTVTDANGVFVLIVRLKTDGSDVGTVSAITADAQGALSKPAFVDVIPTPP